MDPNLSLNDICSYLNISTSYFSTIFKEMTGETFYRSPDPYLEWKKAKELLENTTLKNYEIAEKGRICRCTLLWNFLQEDDRLHTDRICKGESQMKKRTSTVIVGKFKSIQSVIFSTVCISGSHCSCDRDGSIHAFYQYFYF